MITTIRPDEGDALTVPTHPDGGSWQYSLTHGEGGAISFADSAGELVAQVIDGYDDIGHSDADHDTALFSRRDHLLQIAAQAQEGYLRAAVDADDIDLDAVGEDVLTALFRDRADPYLAAEGEWTQQVALVLVRTDYEPFTARECPTGRIVWLDPSTETSYLTSLHSLGLVSFLARA